MAEGVALQGPLHLSCLRSDLRRDRAIYVVQSEWRARELDMGIKDHKLALKGLTHSLQVQSAQLERQRMRLQALLGN